MDITFRDSLAGIGIDKLSGNFLKVGQTLLLRLLS